MQLNPTKHIYINWSKAMTQVAKQEKRTMEIELIDFEKAFEELSGFISCDFDTMVRQLNSGAIFQSIFFTYKLEQ